MDLKEPGLTRRELQVLRLIAAEKSNTVEYRVTNILEKPLLRVANLVSGQRLKL